MNSPARMCVERHARLLDVLLDLAVHTGESER